MADDSNVYSGTWRIVKCMSLADRGSDASDIEGTEFTLDESGDVTWKVAVNAEIMPIFNCETYEVFLGNPNFLRFFGTVTGHVIEFKVDLPKEDCLQLTYEGWYVLQCEKVSSNETKNDHPFSFLCALDEGYFSDITINAENGKEFKAHKVILNFGNPEVDWNQNPTPMDGLPNDVIQTLLHYMYSECLPESLEEETARKCLIASKDIPGFEKFTELCEFFLKNTALKQLIIGLVVDMHNRGNRIIDYFSGKACEEDDSPVAKEIGVVNPPSNGPLTNGEGDNLSTNPAKLCYVIKQALREGAITGTKLVMLCDIFSRKHNELSREERHEIMKYCKSRLPHFLNQLHKLLEVIKQSFSNLSDREWLEIASYMEPEFEATVSSMSQFMMEVKGAVEQIINLSNVSIGSEKSFGSSSSLDHSQRGNVAEQFSMSLKKALHFRELLRLRSFHGNVINIFSQLVYRKDRFERQTSYEKVRYMARNFEEVIEEIPLLILRIKEFKAAVDEKLSWKEWKCLFKLCTSKVAWVLSKLVHHHSILKNIINNISEFVNREQFTKSLVQLGLLDPPPPPPTPPPLSIPGSDARGSIPNLKSPPASPMQRSSTNGVDSETSGSSVFPDITEILKSPAKSDTSPPSPFKGKVIPETLFMDYNQIYWKTPTTNHSLAPKIWLAKGGSGKYLNLQGLAMIESLCRSPLSRDSTLAKNSVQLLRSGQGTDVSFEIRTINADTVIDHTQGIPSVEEEIESYVVRAHCVVIAARCDWFRRALLSGMKESIDKRIVVHDTTPTLFRIFLEYLYGGHLDSSQLSTEQLADLMQLSDRYEVDNLKVISEEALKNHIDDDTALFLLSIADQFNARNLRNSTLEFIAMNKEIIRSEVFYELPEDLQSEVEDMITWAELRSSARSEFCSLPQFLGPDSPSSMSSSLLDIEELTSAMNVSGKEGDVASDSSSLEDLPLTQDSTQLEACVAQLRDIVGEAVPREELVQVSLAADYDVNRALNFFFSS